MRRRVSSPTIADIWIDESGAVSHWLLLLNGIPSPEERVIASDLLLWQHCVAGPDAQARVLPSSERELFGYASQRFRVTAPPVLLVSGDPLFSQYLRVDAALLARLSTPADGLQKFIGTIHWELMNGCSIEVLAANLAKEEFWNTMKVMFKEAKGLFSIEITNGKCRGGHALAGGSMRASVRADLGEVHPQSCRLGSYFYDVPPWRFRYSGLHPPSHTQQFSDIHRRSQPCSIRTNRSSSSPEPCVIDSPRGNQTRGLYAQTSPIFTRSTLLAQSDRSAVIRWPNHATMFRAIHSCVLSWR